LTSLYIKKSELYQFKKTQHSSNKLGNIVNQIVLTECKIGCHGYEVISFSKGNSEVSLQCGCEQTCYPFSKGEFFVMPRFKFPP